MDAAGKPPREQNRGPDKKVLVYEKKTFDRENQNVKDLSARFLQEMRKREFHYSSIEFVPEM